MIKSPCVKKCTLIEGTCSGCNRTSDEISNWSTYSEQDKEKILIRLKKEKEDQYWPDLSFPPINLPVMISARWL